MTEQFQAHDLVDWPARLAVERPLIERVLAQAPSKRVLDLGCGVGHHAMLMAELGYEVLAIDISGAVIEEARRGAVPPGVEFVITDMGAIERTGRGHFGAAVALGNSLASLISPESLSRMLVGLKRRLLPGAPILFQLRNYDRVALEAERGLPSTTIQTTVGDLIVVRQIEPREDGVVLHTTEVRRTVPGSGSEPELVETISRLRQGWRRSEIERLCDVSRLRIVEAYGSMDASPYDAAESPELVIVGKA